jgi:hypothetical protein
MYVSVLIPDFPSKSRTKILQTQERYPERNTANVNQLFTKLTMLPTLPETSHYQEPATGFCNTKHTNFGKKGRSPVSYGYQRILDVGSHALPRF